MPIPLNSGHPLWDPRYVYIPYRDLDSLGSIDVRNIHITQSDYETGGRMTAPIPFLYAEMGSALFFLLLLCLLAF